MKEFTDQDSANIGAMLQTYSSYARKRRLAEPEVTSQLSLFGSQLMSVDNNDLRQQAISSIKEDMYYVFPIALKNSGAKELSSVLKLVDNVDELKLEKGTLPPNDDTKSIVGELMKKYSQELSKEERGQHLENLRTVIQKSPSNAGKQEIHLAGETKPVGAKKFLQRYLDDTPAEERLEVVKSKDGYGRNLLHIEAENGRKDLTDSLLGRFPKEEQLDILMEKDAYGRTPLHVAAQFGKADVLFGFLEGHSPQDQLNLLSEKNYYKQTPAKVASSYGHNFIRKKIKKTEEQLSKDVKKVVPSAEMKKKAKKAASSLVNEENIAEAKLNAKKARQEKAEKLARQKQISKQTASEGKLEEFESDDVSLDGYQTPDDIPESRSLNSQKQYVSDDESLSGYKTPVEEDDERIKEVNLDAAKVTGGSSDLPSNAEKKIVAPKEAIEEEQSEKADLVSVSISQEEKSLSEQSKAKKSDSLLKGEIVKTSQGDIPLKAVSIIQQEPITPSTVISDISSSLIVSTKGSPASLSNDNLQASVTSEGDSKPEQVSDVSQSKQLEEQLKQVLGLNNKGDDSQKTNDSEDRSTKSSGQELLLKEELDQTKAMLEESEKKVASKAAQVKKLWKEKIRANNRAAAASEHAAIMTDAANYEWSRANFAEQVASDQSYRATLSEEAVARMHGRWGNIDGPIVVKGTTYYATSPNPSVPTSVVQGQVEGDSLENNSVASENSKKHPRINSSESSLSK